MARPTQTYHKRMYRRWSYRPRVRRFRSPRPVRWFWLLVLTVLALLAFLES